VALPDLVIASGTIGACEPLAEGESRGFMFLTLEDEAGPANVIVRPQLYERQRDLVRRPLAALEAVVQREGDQVPLLARRFLAVEDLACEPVAPGYRERATHSRR
jgi:DNA polymerase III alpha subunit